MSKEEQLSNDIARIGSATTAIAADLKTVKDALAAAGDSVSQETLDKLDSSIKALEAIENPAA